MLTSKNSRDYASNKNMLIWLRHQHRIVVDPLPKDSDLAWWSTFLKSKPLSLASFGADHHTFLRSSLDSCINGKTIKKIRWDKDWDIGCVNSRLADWGSWDSCNVGQPIFSVYCIMYYTKDSPRASRYVPWAFLSWTPAWSPRWAWTSKLRGRGSMRIRTQI